MFSRRRLEQNCPCTQSNTTKSDTFLTLFGFGNAINVCQHDRWRKNTLRAKLYLAQSKPFTSSSVRTSSRMRSPRILYSRMRVAENSCAEVSEDFASVLSLSDRFRLV